MNTSVFSREPSLRESLPEVHAEYIFRNSTDGYNYTEGKYGLYNYYNGSTDDTYWMNGALIILIEEFKQGGIFAIGTKYMNRLWTLRVPETTRIPYDPDNFTSFEVPIVVKAYTCEIERIKVVITGVTMC